MHQYTALTTNYVPDNSEIYDPMITGRSGSVQVYDLTMTTLSTYINTCIFLKNRECRAWHINRINEFLSQNYDAAKAQYPNNPDFFTELLWKLQIATAYTLCEEYAEVARVSPSAVNLAALTDAQNALQKLTGHDTPESLRVTNLFGN